MRKIVIGVVLLLLLLALGFYAVGGELHHGGSPTTVSIIANSTIMAITSTISGGNLSPLKGAVDTGPSYGNIKLYAQNYQAADAELQMLYDTNSSAIRIDLSYDAWIQNNATEIAAYDSFVSNIGAHGKTFVIADSAAEYYRIHKLSWSQFRAAWVQRVATLAARYHPAYYVVVKEPGWYFPMISGFPPLNSSDWINLTQQLITAVKNVSPNTQVGIAVPGNMYHESTRLDLNYLIAARNLAGLDFIGFDIYGPVGQNDTQTFLNTYGSGGKRVWIAETWGTSSSPYNQSRSSADVAWIKSIYAFGQQIHAQYVFPFYTNIFASYSQPPSNATQLVAYFQNRTPVFYAYKNITVTNST